MLTYALFPQIGLKFIENRGNPDAFEPAPSAQSSQSADVAQVEKTAANTSTSGSETYDVNVDGKVYHVEVAPSGTLKSVKPAGAAQYRSHLSRPLSL